MSTQPWARNWRDLASARTYSAGNNVNSSTASGQFEGPENIWGAIRSLRVDRLGHGIRAFEDPLLLSHLAEKEIPLNL
ncbi:MAG TPA: hypothetical protein EYO90_01240 [Candidatus Latescibacteria bacterium]|nr:hypothetical protein [Candidatus Latescibacterota bacterium]